MRSILHLVFALLMVFELSGLCSPAYAQVPPPRESMKDIRLPSGEVITGYEEVAPDPKVPSVPEPGFFSNIQNSAVQFAGRLGTDLSKKLSDTGMGFGKVLIMPALELAGSLTLIFLLYQTILFMGSKSGSLVIVIFDVAIPAGVAALLISNYELYMPAFSKLLDLFRNVAGGDPVGLIMKFYGSALAMIGRAISHAVNSYGTAALPHSGWSFSSALGNFLNVLLTVLFAVAVLFVLFLNMAEVIGLLLLGPFLYAIGVAFGPLMLAGLVTPWTRDYFGKWVQFIVASAVVTGVLTLVISIAGTIFDNMGFGEFSTGEPTATTLAMVAILLMSVNALISQTPAIASAMVPGSLGANSGGGKAVTKVVAKGQGVVAKSAGKAVGAGVSKGMGVGVQSAKKVISRFTK